MASINVIISKSRAHGCSDDIQISGSKNATLPLMAACLLTDEQVVLKNVPQISDTETMKTQLQSYGVQVNENGSNRLSIQATRRQTEFSPTNSKGSNTRGSFLVLGPLLARFGKAKVYRPGGCQIGRDGRPVNFHIDALQRMGARLEYNREYVELNANQGLHGAEINFPRISVGATETVIMAACLADGQTVIRNAAVEPEIIDLIEMLKKMGMNGHIQVNERQNLIVINGRGRTLLNGCTHTVIPDRIEAGTWAIAAGITGRAILLKMNPDIGRKIMVPVIQKLQEAGVSSVWTRNGLQIQPRQGQIKPVDITTGPFPAFPTDLLPQWVTFMTLANGRSTLEDTIYDNRFGHVQHLERMGAQFSPVSDQVYHVLGKARLRAGNRPVKATDLRAGVALVLAALVAEGNTKIEEFQHVLRGYENIKEKLKCWGVTVQNLPPNRQGFYGGANNDILF